MDTCLIYVRSKTSESDKEAVHIWKEEIQRSLKKSNNTGKTPRTIWNVRLSFT